MYGNQTGEFVCGYWGLEGLTHFGLRLFSYQSHFPPIKASGWYFCTLCGLL